VVQVDGALEMVEMNEMKDKIRLVLRKTSEVFSDCFLTSKPSA